jgi:lipopolysaccharide biosynthesis regulator YciM
MSSITKLTVAEEYEKAAIAVNEAEKVVEKEQESLDIIEVLIQKAIMHNESDDKCVELVRRKRSIVDNIAKANAVLQSALVEKNECNKELDEVLLSRKNRKSERKKVVTEAVRRHNEERRRQSENMRRITEEKDRRFGICEGCMYCGYRGGRLADHTY